MNNSLRPIANGIVLLAALFAGCSGGTSTSRAQQPNSAHAEPSTSPSSPDASVSTGAQIKALEAAGTLPTLDRSTELAGPDLNHNGVRDDIEKWINRLDITAVQKNATMQMAQALQNTLFAGYDDASLDKASEDTSDAVTCLFSTFPEETETPLKLSRQLEAFTANTALRAMQYIQYNALRSGSVSHLKSNTCR